MEIAPHMDNLHSDPAATRSAEKLADAIDELLQVFVDEPLAQGHTLNSREAAARRRALKALGAYSRENK